MTWSDLSNFLVSDPEAYTSAVLIRDEKSFILSTVSIEFARGQNLEIYKSIRLWTLKDKK